MLGGDVILGTANLEVKQGPILGQKPTLERGSSVISLSCYPTHPGAVLTPDILLREK